MIPDDVVSDCLVPDTKYVFFLGCFESRVTIYSQQVRALNLADALVVKKIIRDGSRVAVVGGGAAGITFAAAVALACPNIKSVQLFEQRGTLLNLQHAGRDRYIHPHLYDWPAPGCEQVESGLPILGWKAGSAAEVAAQIEEQFLLLKASAPNLETLSPRTVASVTPQPFSGSQVKIDGTIFDGGRYDVVVLSIGFGMEALICEANHSYWAPSLLASKIPSTSNVQTFFVSGNGDGGLVDFAMAAFNGMTHEAIIKFISTYHELEEVKKELLAIEEEAWAKDAAIDIFEEYRRRLDLPTDMYMRVFEMLRENSCVTFHTREARLFRRETSILNRFIVFVIIAANANAGGDKVNLIIGKEFEGGLPVSGVVQIQGEIPFTPSYRFLRLGADATANLSPFASLVSKFHAREGKTISGYRPATPQLTESARIRFAEFSSPQTANELDRSASYLIQPEPSLTTSQADFVTRSPSAGNPIVTGILLKKTPMQVPADVTRSAATTTIIAESEIDARRYAINTRSYSRVSFITYGTDIRSVGRGFSDAKRDEVKKATEDLAPPLLPPTDTSAKSVVDKRFLEENGDMLCEKVLNLLRVWEREQAIVAASELELWAVNNEAHISSELRTKIYECLLRTEIFRIDAGVATSLEDSRARARHFLTKAKNG